MRDDWISELLSPSGIPNEIQIWKIVYFRPFMTGWGGIYCLSPPPIKQQFQQPVSFQMTKKTNSSPVNVCCTSNTIRSTKIRNALILNIRHRLKTLGIIL
jgi:hypothetical protein